MTDIHKIWKLNDRMQRNALRVKSVERMSKDEVRMLRNGEMQHKALTYRQYMGKVPTDLIGTGWGGGYFLLSNRIVKVLLDRKFTGWFTYPIRVFGKDGDEISGYHGFGVTGRCGPVDNSQHLKILEATDAKFVKVRGIHFDEKTWDGSDIFMTAGGGHIFLTEAVHDAIVEVKPTNIKLTRLDETTRIITKMGTKT